MWKHEAGSLAINSSALWTLLMLHHKFLWWLRDKEHVIDKRKEFVYLLRYILGLSVRFILCVYNIIGYLLDEIDTLDFYE
jgi:hypothetical protein